MPELPLLCFYHPLIMKYVLYVRKSSESEDRQVQSIDDQINRLHEIAKNLGLTIVKTFQESKSAKAPNNRPIFDMMLKYIEDGKADGILCWQINRLSRNPIDSARVQWLLQQGILKSIQTIDKEYRPEDNVLLFSVESGSANQFILDLSKSVKRGINSKLEKGVYPGSAVVGYINNKTDHTIEEDSERFPLTRKMWDLMLTGNYTPPQILSFANDDWGFCTLKTKKTGGKKLSRTSIYRIFTNPFYAGLIRWNGQCYEGSHTSMITIEEFDRVQKLLGRKGKPRPKKYEFAFTGMIRCEECGCMITAQEKTKYVKSTGKTHKYTYYHCTQKRDDYKCTQKKHVRVEVLEEQIDQEIQKISILPEFKDWALDVLKEEYKKETLQNETIKCSVQNALNSAERKLCKLTDLLLGELITEEEFTKKKSELQKEVIDLKSKRNTTEDRAENWQELTEKTFHFVTHARYHFKNGDLRTKKEILSALGQNFLLKDGKLTIELNEWLVPIKNEYPDIEEKYKRLEPEEKRIVVTKKDSSEPLRSDWLGWRDSNPRMPGPKPGALPLGHTPLQKNQKQDSRSSILFKRLIFTKDFLGNLHFWSHLPESNRRPTRYECVALPSELKWQRERNTSCNECILFRF